MTAEELIAEIERVAGESPDGLNSRVYVTRRGQALGDLAADQFITVYYDADDPEGIWLDTIES